MAVVIPDATLIDLVTDTQVHVSAWRVVLFSNNYTPVVGSSWANLTEATFPGYSRQTPTFGTPTVTSSVASSVGSQVTFTCTGGGASQDIYGWALIDTTPGTPEILAANRFSGAPIAMVNNGDFIKVTLTETGQQA